MHSPTFDSQSPRDSVLRLGVAGEDFRVRAAPALSPSAPGSTVAANEQPPGGGTPQ